MAEPHVWKGKPIETIGDLIDAIAALESREEAQEFITDYRAISEHADANAGYVTGYLPAERGQELREWMGAAHPIFGMSSPTAAEAIAAGKASAERSRTAAS